MFSLFKSNKKKLKPSLSPIKENVGPTSYPLTTGNNARRKNNVGVMKTYSNPVYNTNNNNFKNAPNNFPKNSANNNNFKNALNSFPTNSANNALKRFANAKGITNVRSYNKTTTQRNNLVKNRVLFFNKNNKKPLLAFVPQKLRDSNISAIGKILGREYVFQPSGPMGPGHYNKQFAYQLTIPNNPLLPGPIVPSGPGPIVPFDPSPVPIITNVNNNNILRRCNELLRQKAMIEKQLRELGCSTNRSKNYQ